MSLHRYWFGLIILLLLISACSPGLEVLSPSQSHNDPSELRYLALGDSYTVGEGIGMKKSLPYQLVDALLKEGYSFGEPSVIARTGWTTDELLRAIEENPPQGSFDLVTLLIGVNNQFRGYSPETYRSEFKELLNLSIQYAGNNPACVIVLSIPDWGVTPFARLVGFERGQIALQIDRFNRINREESDLAGVGYVDITAISRQAADEPSLIAGDGLHPSPTMIQAWVEQALPQVKACLINP